MPHGFEHIKMGRKPMKYDYRDFRLTDFITPAMRRRIALTTSNEWKVDHILDQGNTPHCVGFAWAGFGVSLPVFDNWDNVVGDKIYYAAKVIDGEPNAEDGSTTRSGVKAFMQFGSLQNNAYAFANSLQDVIDWLLVNGPVVTGTNWYDGMFSPDSGGLVKISGSLAGGHEWMLSGVDTVARTFKATNSWGTSFGIEGQFYIGFDDYQRLLNEEGDACTAVEVVAPPTPTPTPAPTPTPTPTPSGCLPRALRALGLV
jgi:hypothetical protein